MEADMDRGLMKALLLISVVFCLTLTTFADDKPALSYNESGTVLFTINKHGHFYQVATDSRIYLLMCAKVKIFQFGPPECRIGQKSVAAGDTVKFRVEGDWAYMPPVSDGIEEKLRILTTELKNIPPLPPAPPATTGRNSKTTAAAGVVMGTGMHVKGRHGASWSINPMAPVSTPVVNAGASIPVMPTAPVVATPVTGGPPVVMTPVAPTTGSVVVGVPVTGGAPITAVSVGPVTGMPLAGASSTPGGAVTMGGGAPQWVHVLRIQTGSRIYQLECSRKPCKAANKEILLGDSVSLRVDKKWAYMSSGAQASSSPGAEEQKFRILSVSELASAHAPASKTQEKQ